MNKNWSVTLVIVSILLQRLSAQERRLYTSTKRDCVTFVSGYFKPMSDDDNTGGPFYSAGYFYEASPGLFGGATLDYFIAESSVMSDHHIKSWGVNFLPMLKYLVIVSDVDPFVGVGAGPGWKHIDWVLTGDHNDPALAGVAGLMVRMADNVHAIAELRCTGTIPLRMINWITRAVSAAVLGCR